MARGMILVLSLMFASSAMALSDVEKCARKADRLVEKRNSGKRVERVEFKNTTPGSYDQEYTGLYEIDGQRVIVEFYSPFICDQLRIISTAR